jgi:hypothetical protein
MKRLILAIAAASFGGPVLAQPVLFDFVGDGLHDAFGRSLDAIGDFNGDGIPDILIGAPQGPGECTGPGYVRVYSGRDGSTLLTVAGANFCDSFGKLVRGLGDVNLDGTPDFFVGQNFSSQVISGRTGLALYGMAMEVEEVVSIADANAMALQILP